MLQHFHPIRRKIHVNDNFHTPIRGSSISSTRQAAYVKAAPISSASRYGYALRISLLSCPAAMRPIIIPTVTRRPRIVGLPPITLGSKVMRFKFFIFVLLPVFYTNLQPALCPYGHTSQREPTGCSPALAPGASVAKGKSSRLETVTLKSE